MTTFTDSAAEKLMQRPPIVVREVHQSGVCPLRDLISVMIVDGKRIEKGLKQG